MSCRDFDPQPPLQPVQLGTESKKEMLKRRAPEKLEEISKNLTLKIQQMLWSPNCFNLTAVLMSCRNSRKGNVPRTQPKAMSGQLEIFMLGELQGMNSTALMASYVCSCINSHFESKMQHNKSNTNYIPSC